MVHETTEENGLQRLFKWFYDGLEESALMVTDQVKTWVQENKQLSRNPPPRHATQS
jgi:hypothetical protein